MNWVGLIYVQLKILKNDSIQHRMMSLSGAGFKAKRVDRESHYACTVDQE